MYGTEARKKSKDEKQSRITNDSAQMLYLPLPWMRIFSLFYRTTVLLIRIHQLCAKHASCPATRERALPTIQRILSNTLSGGTSTGI